MKTILFISPTGTFDNGAEESIFNLMKYLANNGYEVINVAPTAGYQKENAYSERCNRHGITCFLVQTQRWWWEDAPGQLFGTVEERASSYRETIAFIRQKICEHNVNLVMTNTVNMFQGAIAAACENVKHIWLIHEFPSGEFAYYRDKLDFISEYSDEIYSVDGELNKELNQLFFERKIKKFSPYTEVVSKQLIEGKSNRLVSVGRLTERKNQLELLKAYKKISSTNNLELVFIGAWDEDYKKKCMSYIAENKLKNIKFTGNLENPWSVISDKDICVFPSSMETFGLVYVEAVLNGIPTILSDNLGHLSAYNIFETGNLYVSGDVDDLVEKIENVLHHFTEKKENAMAYIKSAKNKYQVQNVYREILSDITCDIQVKSKNIRHIANLVSNNERKSKIALFESKGRRYFQRIKAKLRR